MLLAWSAIMPKTQPIVNKEVAAINQVKTELSAITTPLETPQKPTSTTEIIKFDQPAIEVSFIESQGAIKEVNFKKFKSHVFVVGEAFLLEDAGLNFKKQSQGQNEITFVHSDKEKIVTKRFTFANSSYSIKLDVTTRNISNASIKLKPYLIIGTLNFALDPKNSTYQDITAATTEKTLHPNSKKTQIFNGLKFISIRDRYFCLIVQSDSKDTIGFSKSINKSETVVGLYGGEIELKPNVQSGHSYASYLGPQEFNTIKALNPDWTSVMYFGTFDFIAQLLLQLLEFLHGIVHNWGWAIVILSVIIYLILYPLSIKQMRSMKEMQSLQPRIEELRRQHKDNPQKLNKEIMELYREHKVNPLGGCLPMLLQIPVFFALYQALVRSVTLKGANFLWIKDLSEPDKLFTLSKGLPLIGKDINILPLLMMIGMFFQQKMTMKTGAGAGGNEQQKIMLIIFPLMFGFIFYNMPSGLVLYWFVNSALMLIQQMRMVAKS